MFEKYISSKSYFRLIAASVAVGILAQPVSVFAAARGYVTNAGGNNVTVFNASTTATITTVAVGNDPRQVAINGTGAYVVNLSSNSVSLIDTSRNTVVRTITVGSSPWGIGINETGAYVTNVNANSVSIIDITKNTVVRTIGVGANPRGVAFSLTGAYITNFGDSTVSLIDTTKYSVVRTIGVGGNPLDLAVSGTGIYVVNLNDDNVSLIDKTTDTVERTIGVGDGPADIVVNGTGAYVSNNYGDTVSVIDLNRNTLAKTITVGDIPYGMATNGTGVYVTNINDNTVSVIDKTTNSVDTTFSVGSSPYYIAFRADQETDTPILTSPASSSTNAPKTLSVSFTLPETAAANTVSLNFNNGIGTNVTVTLRDASSASFTLDLHDISASSHVLSSTANSIDDGTYTLTLSYQDELSHPAASTTSTSVVIATPAASSSSSSQEIFRQNGGSREVTLGMKMKAAQDRFGASSSAASVASKASSSSSSTTYFKDTPLSAWFYGAVEKLRLKNVISGYKDKNGADTHVYGPANVVTYGQLAKMLMTITNHAPAGSKATLNWAEPYVRQARTLGLSIYQNDKLNLDTPASRGAVARTLVQAYGITLGAAPQSPFTDLPATHPYAKDILTAVSIGLMSGDAGKKTIRPDAPVNRAEIAKMLDLISSRFVPIAKTASSAASEAQQLMPEGKDIRFVMSQILNVRADARINAGILWVAKKGTLFEVLNIAQKDWAHVRTADGREGYVWAKELVK